MPRPAPLLAAAAILTLLPGCTAPVITGVAAVAEYGTSTFNSGALETYYPNRFYDTVVAVRTAISQLGLRPISDVPDEGNAFVYIKAVDETDAEIWFRIRRRGEMLTMVSIRVGLLGDEPYATALSKHITALLDPDSNQATPPPDLRIRKGEELTSDPHRPKEREGRRPPAARQPR
ncbi:MAG TPA: DUF3568 family protein [Phycisphaerales bacterium]|nr:DUF3568 family protein [Phycisphaerales bacterium]